MPGLKLDYVDKRGLKSFPVNNQWVKPETIARWRYAASVFVAI